MRPWLVFVLLSSFVGANPVFAQAKKKAAGKKPASTETKRSADDDVPDASAATDSTSAGIRARKKGHVGLRAGELIGGFSGGGLEGNYYVSSRLQTGLFYAAGSHDFKDELGDEPGLVTEKAETEYTLLYAQARFFVGNSFNLTGGIGQRTFSSDFLIRDASNINSVEITTKASSIVAVFALGNLWSFESGFFLGADWIGYTQPLSSSFSSTTSTKGSAVSAAFTSFEEDAKDLAEFTGKTGATMALVVNLGWAF